MSPMRFVLRSRFNQCLHTHTCLSTTLVGPRSRVDTAGSTLAAKRMHAGRCMDDLAVAMKIAGCRNLEGFTAPGDGNGLHPPGQDEVIGIIMEVRRLSSTELTHGDRRRGPKSRRRLGDP